MKYVIYKLTKPGHLQKMVPDGYHMRELERSVLETLDVSHVNNEHPTMEAAVAEIESHAQELKHETLVILPVIKVNYNGEVS